MVSTNTFWSAAAAPGFALLFWGLPLTSSFRTGVPSGLK